MPFGVSSGIPNVIIHAKFHVNRLRGFWAAGPSKVPFPILIGTTLTTVLSCTTVQTVRNSVHSCTHHVISYVPVPKVAKWRNLYSTGLLINTSWIQIILGAKLRNNLGQVVHACHQASSITWYCPRGGDALQLGR